MSIATKQYSLVLYESLSLEYYKSFFTIQVTADSCNVLNFEQLLHQIENII